MENKLQKISNQILNVVQQIKNYDLHFAFVKKIAPTNFCTCILSLYLSAAKLKFNKTF